MLPVIAIVGRENVGKSTLFNRLVGGKPAITYKKPGTTRDRNIKEVELFGTTALLVDTGGYLPNESHGLKAKVKEQIELSLENANLILFVVDAKSGLIPLDSEFANRLRKLNKKVILVVNKVDTKQRQYATPEFYKLGFPRVVSISSIHGLGINELVDHIKEETTNTEHRAPKTEKLPKFAVLGRPNVGKSTYINALLKEPRVIVDEHPGTTIDSIDVTLNYEGKELILIDTPGVRRRTKVKSDTEFYSSVRMSRSISKCDVGILLVDAGIQLTHQDKRLISMLIKEGKGIVIAANKIDIGVGFREEILEFARFIPVTYISALKGKKIYEPVKEGLQVWTARRLWISKRKLRELEKLWSRLKIMSMVQARIEPPEFRIKSRRKLTPQDKRFVERELRASFGFIGTPLRM